jgi:hypothetical protein
MSHPAVMDRRDTVERASIETALLVYQGLQSKHYLAEMIATSHIAIARSRQTLEKLADRDLLKSTYYRSATVLSAQPQLADLPEPPAK